MRINVWVSINWWKWYTIIETKNHKVDASSSDQYLKCGICSDPLKDVKIWLGIFTGDFLMIFLSKRWNTLKIISMDVPKSLVMYFLFKKIYFLTWNDFSYVACVFDMWWPPSLWQTFVWGYVWNYEDQWLSFETSKACLASSAALSKPGQLSLQHASLGCT